MGYDWGNYNMNLTTRRSPLDIYREFPDLHSLGRKAFRLHPRRSDNLPAQCSKMGGQFINPAGMIWPHLDELPYMPVLQIFKRDLLLKEQLVSSVIPLPHAMECLQLLWLPGAEFDVDNWQTRSREDYYPRIVVRWFDVEQVRTAVPHTVSKRDADALGDSLFPAECLLTPEPILDYPHRWALSGYFEDLLLANPRFMQLAEEHGDVDNPLGYYQECIGAAPGIKLGGHPSWIQYPEWPMSDKGLIMEHLLTIASWEWDGGTHWRWKPVEDGDPASPEGPNDDAGLMIGDAGDAYVFVAPNGTAKVVTQCS
jgi:hypothetical protein